MDSDAFLKLQALFDEALEHPSEKRLDWLSSRDDLDPVVAEELRRLLVRESGHVTMPEGLPVQLLASALSVEATPTFTHARAGRFRLVEELGRGGMGCVYRGVCDDGGVHQEVAVKILRSELRDSGAFERFLRERRMLAKLDHPGIARLLDSGETEDGTPFVAMELVAGQSFLAFCLDERLDIRERVALVRQVVAAVAHAHRALIVHRDIKPSNVMVDAEGRIRLLDFGIAKALHESSEATAAPDRYFTPAYAAPEQLIGGLNTVACDVYALGALLYEVVSGVPPFDVNGKRAAEIERLVLETPPRSLESAYTSMPREAQCRLASTDPSSWRIRLRGDLNNIVQQALRKEPDSRYPSAEALDQELERWMAHRPVQASGSSVIYQARKFVRRNRIGVAASAVVLLGSVMAAVLIVRQGVVASRERDRAREALAILRDAFVAADPAGSSGGGANARSILKVASKRISEQISAHPALYAELAAEIGSVQLAIGIVDTDDATLATAQKWANGRYGNEELATRLALLKARKLIARHAFDEADHELSALENMRPKDPVLMLLRGKYWLARQDAKLAMAFLKPAAEQLAGRHAGDQDSTLGLDAVWQLAEAQRISGDPSAALTTLRTAQESMAIQYPDDHALILLTRLRAVQELIDLDRIDEAIAESQSVTRILEVGYGRASTVTALAYTTLAYALERSGRKSESIEPYQNAAESYAESLGPNHITTARSTFNLAFMLSTVDPDNPLIERYFADAIAAASIARTPTDPLVLYFRIKLAMYFHARHDADGVRRSLLPDDSTIDLTTASVLNATDYLTLLGTYFGPITCGPDAGKTVAETRQISRARTLFCKGIESKSADR